jgi:hypothetical protein
LDPAGSWERIAAAQRKWFWILLIYLIPLWMIVAAAEGYGLIRWGKPRGEVSQLTPHSVAETVVFEIIQTLLFLVVVVVGAKLIKALGETFHGRHTFTQAFTVAAYGLSPMFAVHAFDVFPGISPWVTWGVGIALCISILYHGVPQVMLPDPPHAFGLYMISAVLLTLVSGLARFMTLWYLQGKLPKMEMLVQKLIDHLPVLQSLNNLHF